MMGGRKPDDISEFLQRSFGVDRFRDANRSRPDESRSPSFRFDGVDPNCRLTRANQAWVDRHRD
jgi:hypothetical protein